MPKKRQIMPISTIGGRLDTIISYLHIDAKKFASMVNISEGHLSDLRNGKVELSDKVLRSIEMSLFVHGEVLNREWLLNGSGEMFTHVFSKTMPFSGDYHEVGLYYMAGAGNTCQLAESEPFDTLFIKKDFISNHIIVVKVRGRSMEPTIMSGALVGVDIQDRQPVSGEIFAIWIDGEGALIKRIHIDVDHTIHIISDNPDSKRFPIMVKAFSELNDHFIQGRVKWVIQKF